MHRTQDASRKHPQPPLGQRVGTALKQLGSDIFYALCQLTSAVVFRMCFRIRVHGLQYCPKSGPLLVVSNHISEWDPVFLGCLLPWQVHWLAKIQLFNLWHGRMHGFFRMMHCVPVDRDKADLAAIKQVVRLLKDSRPVVIFCEGGVRRDERSLLGDTPELKGGAAAIAKMAKCPILPVLINGTFAAYKKRNWLGRRRLLEMVVGPVFELDDHDRERATESIMAHLLALKPQLVQQRPA